MSKYYKVHYTNNYDEIELTSFDIVTDYYEMLEVLEYYYNSVYYTNVYVTEVEG